MRRIHLQVFADFCRKLLIGHLPAKDQTEGLDICISLQWSKSDGDLVQEIVVILSSIGIYDGGRVSVVVSVGVKRRGSKNATYSDSCTERWKHMISPSWISD
jgi:hypothetical protein